MLIEVWREETAEKPKTKEQELFFIFDNYVALHQFEFTQTQIDKLNSIGPKCVELIEGEVINAYQEAIGA